MNQKTVNHDARRDSASLSCEFYSKENVKMEESGAIWGFACHGLKIEFNSEMTIWYAVCCFTTQTLQRSQNINSIYRVKIEAVIITRYIETQANLII